MLQSLNSQPTIDVENLHKNFGSAQVLRGVSLTAKKGDVIALIGASGCGKTTFLRCINCLELPSQGRIEICGEELVLRLRPDGNLHPVDQNHLRRLRTRLGMVFQNFNLWQHMTVLQNVAEAPRCVLRLSKTEAQERAMHYLAQVGLAGKRGAYPATLSGGEKQRVAIARALAMEPDALLLDEPSSALDPVSARGVLQVIEGLAAEGRTMVIVTHEMAFAKAISNQVLFLEDGLVVEQGEPDQIFRSAKTENLRNFIGGRKVENGLVIYGT